ncbi:hypothetical protein [Massilia niastensis]|uniref:hypothetical protein n=1 Tax=Massilia niastensis TaxID=544911 RepID=UPI00039E656C|nr:hypothetical protein [Massilia niastensis]
MHLLKKPADQTPTPTHSAMAKRSRIASSRPVLTTWLGERTVDAQPGHPGSGFSEDFF